MGPADAGGAVGKQVGPYQIAKPATGGSQLFDLKVLAEERSGVSWRDLWDCRERDRGCARAFDVRPVEVNFQAGDNLSPLPVVAPLEAAKAATRTHARKVEPIERRCLCDPLELSLLKGSVSRAAAAVCSDIEPGPLGHSDNGRRCRRRRPPHGNIGRNSRSSARCGGTKQRNGAQKLTTHEVLLIDTSRLTGA